MTHTEQVAFPQLTEAELAVVRPLATAREYADGEIVFRAGQADIDLYIVESGQIEIQNPSDGHTVIVVHEPGQFSGDIDLLTRRPVIVTAVARGQTRVLCVPGDHLRSLLNRVPSFGEKLMTAFTRRRELLSQMGTLGLRVVGPGRCRDTNTVREFLYKNFVPFSWLDTETDEGQAAFTALGSPRKTPAIECGNGKVLLNPTLQELAVEAGVWRHCPTQEVDLVIVGAGSSGHRRRRLCIVGRDLHLDARSAGTGRTSWRFVADRKLHRLPGRLERRGLGDARGLADAQVRRSDCRPGRGRETNPREVRRRLTFAQPGLRRRDSLPSVAARLGRPLAASGSRRRRPICRLGNLLRLHDCRGRSFRRRRCRGGRRRQFGRAGRHVFVRVLSHCARCICWFVARLAPVCRNIYPSGSEPPRTW